MPKKSVEEIKVQVGVRKRIPTRNRKKRIKACVKHIKIGGKREKPNRVGTRLSS